MLPILSHTELAKQIAGKRILHLNSLGKDAILCLEWLNNYAHPSEIVSLFFKFEAGYPTDARYWEYLKKRYPRTKFVTTTDPAEINDKTNGWFQTPLYINYVSNNQEYGEFDRKKIISEFTREMDYACSGISCYEGMGRALYLRRVGLLDEKLKMIYPIGLMKQSQVLSMLKSCGVKLNPSYKHAPESHDSASYFKMRYAFIANPEFKETMYKHYPMLALDEYRYERLLCPKK